MSHSHGSTPPTDQGRLFARHLVARSDALARLRTDRRARNDFLRSLDRLCREGELTHESGQLMENLVMPPCACGAVGRIVQDDESVWCGECAEGRVA